MELMAELEPAAGFVAEEQPLSSNAVDTAVTATALPGLMATPLSSVRPFDRP
jgi:hypothetical protein